MKNLNFFYKVSALLLVFLIIGSCQRDEFEFKPEIQPGKVESTGIISIPGNVDISDWQIQSGLSYGDISGKDYEISLNENTVQLITVNDKDGIPILMSVDATRSQSSETEISVQTTAEALVFLNPFFCTSEIEEAEELKSRIHELPSFGKLVNDLSLMISEGSFSFTNDNLELIEILEDLFQELSDDLTEEYEMSKFSPSKGFINSPDFPLNGLDLVEISQSGGELSFKVKNEAKRWISVYVDKSEDGENYYRSPMFSDLIPSPSVDILYFIKVVTQGLQPPSQISREISTTTTGYQSIAVKCYGLGVANFSNDEEFQRAILPAVTSVVFDFTIPIFEIISSTKFSSELRGSPANHPFYKLVEKAVEDIVQDPTYLEDLYRWYHSGDIAKIAIGVVKRVLSICAENPTYVADILSNMLGQQVARALVSNWLFPIKVINASVTAVNLGYTIGSILSTEAVTSFKFGSETTNYPLSITGNVKSYLSMDVISGANVAAYGEAGNLLDNTLTDIYGNYTLSSTSGNIMLRTVAYGYKPVDQVIFIPEDILTQDPPVYYASTTWMSDYSTETGQVSGKVVDATSIAPVQDVLISLKQGTNDTSAEILQQTSSGSDGSFTFTDLPSGTYTAYFEKEDYISDYLVLSVLGGQSTSGFVMNLSPDIFLNNGYRIVLTWGQNPQDLDSHLFTPLIYGTDYHIYYVDKGSLSGPPYALLDVDDVTSYGPETITISETFPGEYYYSVFHYAGSGSISSTSAATINLYGTDGFIRSWNAPSTGDGLWWNVFSINGTTGAITNINEITSSPPGNNKGRFESDFSKNK